MQIPFLRVQVADMSFGFREGLWGFRGGRVSDVACVVGHWQECFKIACNPLVLVLVVVPALVLLSVSVSVWVLVLWCLLLFNYILAELGLGDWF